MHRILNTWYRVQLTSENNKKYNSSIKVPQKVLVADNVNFTALKQTTIDWRIFPISVLHNCHIINTSLATYSDITCFKYYRQLPGLYFKSFTESRPFSQKRHWSRCALPNGPALQLLIGALDTDVSIFIGVWLLRYRHCASDGLTGRQTIIWVHDNNLQVYCLSQCPMLAKKDQRAVPDHGFEGP